VAEPISFDQLKAELDNMATRMRAKRVPDLDFKPPLPLSGTSVLFARLVPKNGTFRRFTLRFGARLLDCPPRLREFILAHEYGHLPHRPAWAVFYCSIFLCWATEPLGLRNLAGFPPLPPQEIAYLVALNWTGQLINEILSDRGAAQVLGWRAVREGLRALPVPVLRSLLLGYWIRLWFASWQARRFSR